MWSNDASSLLFYTFIAIFGSLFISIIYWYVKLYRYSAGIKNVYSPKSIPLIGIAQSLSDTSLILENVSNMLNNSFSPGVAYAPILNEFVFGVSDPDLAEKIFSSTKLIDKARFYDVLHNWLGTGLLTSTSEKWRKHRKLITPTYHFKILEDFLSIFDTNGSVMISKMRDHCNVVYDVTPAVALCTLDIICESAMGTSVDAQNDTESSYVTAVKTICKILVDRNVSLIESNPVLYPLTPNYWRERNALNILHSYTMGVIQSRKAKLLYKQKNQPDVDVENDVIGRRKKTAFLDLLLEANMKESALSDIDIREEVDTFMFEGHDTTSAAISFAIYCLSNNPAVQKLAFEEQFSIFGDDAHRAATMQDLNDMKYLELVIKETLRLYPSVPIFGREVIEDVRLNDNIFLKKGTQILLCVFQMHRNSVAFPEPESFKPERFLKTTYNPYCYVPFSAGMRNCIGQKFAMLEMKSTLSKVIRNFEIFPAGETPVLLCETILKSANGVKVILQERK